MVDRLLWNVVPHFGIAIQSVVPWLHAPLPPTVCDSLEFDSESPRLEK
jgi:hypothetical protein